MMREKLHEYSYTRKDFRLDWYSGTGAGGQHRNKHQNCLRLTHIPSGITTQSAEHRDRASNLRKAFERLRPLLLSWIRAQIGEKTYPRNDEVVRSYNIVDNRVIDHASGLEMSWSEMEKKFDEMVNVRARCIRNTSAES